MRTARRQRVSIDAVLAELPDALRAAGIALLATLTLCLGILLVGWR